MDNAVRERRLAIRNLTQRTRHAALPD